ncbi:MAG: ATP-binding cassette subfamily B protein, partial [Bacteroidia bacterium]
MNDTATESKAEATFHWSVVRRFLGHFRPYRKQVALGVGLIPVSVVFSIMFPWLIMKIIDEQLVPGHTEGLMFA